MIGVLPDKYMKALAFAEDIPKVEALKRMSMEEALSTAWDTDAHFVAYQVEGAEEYPRLTKQALGWLSVQGIKVATKYLVMELDIEPHTTWAAIGRDQQQVLLEMIVTAAEKVEVLADWRWFYFSAGGCRIIYELPEAIDVEKAESHTRWLLNTWTDAGFDGKTCQWKADPNTADWTRLWRLPRVVRDGVHTGKQSYFELLDVEKVANPDLLGVADKALTAMRARQAAITSDCRMPEPEEVDAILWNYKDSGSASMSEWHRTARGKLRNRECSPYLFEGAQLSEGERDSKLMKLIGQAVSLTMVLPQATPERIYALFFDLASSLEPDVGTPDWHSSVWGKIIRVFGQEMDTRIATREASIVTQQEAKSVGQAIIDGARQWCKDPILQESEEVAMRWLSRRMIVMAKKTMYLMGPDGRYGTLALNDKQLIPRLRQSAMEMWVPTEQETQNGPRDRSAISIINDHATIVAGIVGRASGESGAWITDIGTDHAMLNVPLYSLNTDLEPEYDDDVDMWLRKLFGDQYPMACRWIGHALAFDEGPIAALSITGGAGVGKHLLTQGLAECLRRPALATSKDLVGGRAYGLMKSPFLVVDEGWPQRKSFDMHPADAFRRMVAGEATISEAKFEDPVELNVPVRILFTSNNLDVVNELGHGKTLTKDDRDAIGQRLIHMDVGQEAADWLESKGGLAFTGRKGHRWIQSAAGGESDYVIAKHFLFLYANRGEPDSGRFLVAGSKGASVVHQMRVNSGSVPEIIEAVTAMINSFQVEWIGKNVTRPPGMDGIEVIPSRKMIVVTTTGVLTRYRQTLQKETGKVLKAVEIVAGLRALCDSVSDSPWSPGQGIPRKAWHVIDLEILHEVLMRNGVVCPHVEDIIIDTKTSKRTNKRQEGLDREEIKNVAGEG